MKAFIHFGGPFTADPNGPRSTIEAPVKIDLLPWQERGLMYTATGYGSKIPTRYKIKYLNRWCRVYCAIYGNSGTCYIISKNKPVATVDIYED